MPRKPGAFCGSWAGAASVQWGGRWSGTKKRSGCGSRSVGRRLKKSPPRGPHHSLHRRERIERAPAPLPHLGATGTDAGAAISLQLEDAISDGRSDLVELLLSAVSRCDPQPADHRVPGASAAPPSRQAADRLGWTAGSSQPRDLGVHSRAARATVGRVSSWLCAGTESGRVSMVALETARVAQLLSTELRAVELLRPKGPAPNAQATHPGDCLLAAGRTVSVVTILCNAQ